MKKLKFRPNVCMLVFKKNKKILLAERYGKPGIWQFPQGGAVPSLTLEENVIKELKEELGVKPKYFKIFKKLKARHKYDYINPPSYAKNKWRGQAQTFWLVEFTGKNSDIQINKYEKELMDFKWCTIEQIKELAEPRRLKGYRKALSEARKILKNY